MSTYFYNEQDKQHARLKMYMQEISECQIHDEPCPLLDSQLNELEVLMGRAQRLVHLLRQSMKERKQA